jgi:hypothetical protein
MNNREIPKKNYYIVAVVSVLVIALTLYVRVLYLNYVNNKVENGIFYNKAINQINTDDFDFALGEANEAIMYVSYTGSKDIKKMEKRLYKEIENKNLLDRIIYWDVTNLLENDKYIAILAEKFPNIELDINKAPMLIYIVDGKAVDVIDSSNKLIDYETLNELVNKYGIM